MSDQRLHRSCRLDFPALPPHRQQHLPLLDSFACVGGGGSCSCLLRCRCRRLLPGHRRSPPAGAADVPPYPNYLRRFVPVHASNDPAAGGCLDLGERRFAAGFRLIDPCRCLGRPLQLGWLRCRVGSRSDCPCERRFVVMRPNECFHLRLRPVVADARSWSGSRSSEVYCRRSSVHSGQHWRLRPRDVRNRWRKLCAPLLPSRFRQCRHLALLRPCFCGAHAALSPALPRVLRPQAD